MTSTERGNGSAAAKLTVANEIAARITNLHQRYTAHPMIRPCSMADLSRVVIPNSADTPRVRRFFVHCGLSREPPRRPLTAETWYLGIGGQQEFSPACGLLASQNSRALKGVDRLSQQHRTVCHRGRTGRPGKRKDISMAKPTHTLFHVIDGKHGKDNFWLKIGA